MPEFYDKNGPPKLWITISCLEPDCGGSRLIEPAQAERIAARLGAGMGIRYLIGRCICRKCRARNAKVSFHLAYPIMAKRPKTPSGTPDPRGWPWVGRFDYKGRKIAE